MSSCAHATAKPATGLDRRNGHAYQPRAPERETLHRLVREHLRTLYAALEDGWGGAGLPAFVRADLEGYVKCGVPGRGFAHLQCEGCGRPVLVAFSCGSRGFCPSCQGRRMCQGTVNLLDHVLPQTPPHGGTFTSRSRATPAKECSPRSTCDPPASCG